MSRLRILFAGVFHWNAGSSHMVAEYARAAEILGCEVGVSSQLSRLDGVVDAHLPVVADLAWATHLVLVFEGVQFLSEGQRELCDTVPRHRRIVLDPDGHWGPLVTLGADNSGGPDAPQNWHQVYSELSSLILQPKIGGALPEGAEFFSYFGMPDIRSIPTAMPDVARMPYELQYVGANWWRWTAMTDLVQAAAAARPALTRIRVCGRWWTGAPHPEHVTATSNKQDWLEGQGVTVAPPVPFGQVVAHMAQGAITPILARPLLAELRLLTPRMFETMASGSMLAIPRGLGYLTSLYGDDVAPFLLGEDPSSQLARMLREPGSYRRRLAFIQERLYHRFNYRQVLGELLKLIG
jgi:hypothetical protein